MLSDPICSYRIGRRRHAYVRPIRRSPGFGCRQQRAKWETLAVVSCGGTGDGGGWWVVCSSDPAFLPESDEVKYRRVLVSRSPT